MFISTEDRKKNSGYQSNSRLALSSTATELASTPLLSSALMPWRLRASVARAEMIWRMENCASRMSWRGGTDSVRKMVSYRLLMPPPAPWSQITPKPSRLMPGTKPPTKKWRVSG